MSHFQRYRPIRIALGLLAMLFGFATSVRADNPTNGWTLQPLKYSIQYPYDLKQSDRYSYDTPTDTHHFWVYSNDLPHATTSRTLPRTEMRVEDVYTTGQHQFEADMMVPAGTSNVSLMQVFGGSLRGHSTSLQVRVYAGNLKAYDDTIVATNIYGRWLHLNVTHDVSTHAIQIYVDSHLALATEDNGGKSWYFKCGVYGQEGMSHKMEVYFRNIRTYTK